MEPRPSLPGKTHSSDICLGQMCLSSRILQRCSSYPSVPPTYSYHRWFAQASWPSISHTNFICEVHGCVASARPHQKIPYIRRWPTCLFGQLAWTNHLRYGGVSGRHGRVASSLILQDGVKFVVLVAILERGKGERAPVLGLVRVMASATWIQLCTLQCRSTFIIVLTTVDGARNLQNSSSALECNIRP